MNNDEKMMITIILTAVILVAGMGVTVSYCVSHMGGGDAGYGTDFDDTELKSIVSQLDWKGGTVFTDDGKSINVYQTDIVVEERGMIKITQGSHNYYIPPSRIVSVYI